VPGFHVSEFHDALKLDRKSMAGPQFWLQADVVVEASLRGLPRGKLYVVPGWRYKAIVGLLSVLPTPVRIAVEARGSKKRANRT
jgi:hypothetical protein